MRTKMDIEADIIKKEFIKRELQDERTELTKDIDSRFAANYKKLSALRLELKEVIKATKSQGNKPDTNVILFWRDKTVRLDTRSGYLGLEAWRNILNYGLPDDIEYRG